MKEFGTVSQAPLKALEDNLKETGKKISVVGSYWHPKFQIYYGWYVL